MKKIAVITSGGDAPGMNAAIRSVVRRGLANGLTVYGFNRGYQGMIEMDYSEMNGGSVAGIIQRGGTILRTARSEEFKTKAGRQKAVDNFNELGIEGLIVIGGDGSMIGAENLSKNCGIKTVVIPATIDNDMTGTEYTIGFDTAVNNILEAINKIRDTAGSHQRVAIVEVMGRYSGQLALMSGLCSGSEVLIVPEVPWCIEEVCDTLKASHKKGKLYSIVLVAEGAAKGIDLGEQIEQRTGIEANVTVLGYLQRGGSPSAIDNIMGTRMGAHGVDELLRGEGNVLVGVRGGKMESIPYYKAKEMKHELDLQLYGLAMNLSR